MRLVLLPVAWCLLPVVLAAQAADAPIVLLSPDRIWDGTVMRTGKSPADF